MIECLEFVGTANKRFDNRRYDMRKGVFFTSILLVFGLLSATVYADSVADGKKVAFDRKKGNCIACHAISGGDLPGNAAPPLVAMKARFPDKSALRIQIYDATIKNPNSLMPPFGKHEILTDKEVDQITDYVYTL